MNHISKENRTASSDKFSRTVSRRFKKISKKEKEVDQEFVKEALSSSNDVLLFKHLKIAHNVTVLSDDEIQIAAYVIKKSDVSKTEGSFIFSQSHMKLQEDKIKVLDIKEKYNDFEKYPSLLAIKPKSFKKIPLGRIDALTVEQFLKLGSKIKRLNRAQLAIFLNKFITSFTNKNFKQIKLQEVMHLPSLFIMDRLSNDCNYSHLKKEMQEALIPQRNAYLFLDQMNYLKQKNPNPQTKYIFDIIPLPIFRFFNQEQAIGSLKYKPPSEVIIEMIEGGSFSYSSFTALEDFLEKPLEVFQKVENKVNFYPFFFVKEEAEGIQKLILKGSLLTQAKIEKNYEFLKDFTNLTMMAKAVTPLFTIPIQVSFNSKETPEILIFEDEEFTYKDKLTEKDPPPRFLKRENEFATLLLGSLFPKYLEENHLYRHGDPIADVMMLSSFDKMIVLSGADGCGTGINSYLSAKEASATIQHICLKGAQSRVFDTKNSLAFLLNGFQGVIESFTKKELETEISSNTTLFGLLGLFATDANKWVLSICNVGDMKAFHYKTQERHLTTLLHDHLRTICHRSKNPGGFMGGKGSNDISNLSLLHFIADPGDYLIVMTNGIHDNLRPHNLNVTVEEAKKYVSSLILEDFKNSSEYLKLNTWDGSSVALILEELFVQKKVERLLKGAISKEKNIASHIADSVFVTTMSKRSRFERYDMESQTENLRNSGDEEPSALDRGELDHFGLACIQLRAPGFE